jgi:hypothetical protein
MIHGEVHDAEPALADAPGDLEFAEARSDLQRYAVFAARRRPAQRPGPVTTAVSPDAAFAAG